MRGLRRNLIVMVMVIVQSWMYGQLIITKWNVNTTNKLSSYWENSNGSPTNPSFVFHSSTDTADVQRVCYTADSVYVKATGMTDNMGKFLNPGTPSVQTFVYCFPRNPVVATTKTAAPTSFAIGALLNGIPIYGRGAGTSWGGSGNINGGPQIWNTEVYLSEGFVLDTAFGAHPQQQGQYHTHAKPYRMYEAYSSSVHSPIVGYAFDGYPIYGPYGYSTPTNSNSAVTRMKSGYSLRNISARQTLPDGSTLTVSNYGPNVSATYPIGTYCEDYEWLAANGGDLDTYNGRFCVTPEYPGGTYAYFTTINSAGTPQYPYYIGSQYYGVPNTGNFNSGCLSRVMPSTGLTGCYTPTTAGITLSAATSSVACNGLSTGAATITATGVTGTLTYTWLPSGGTASVATGLAAGNYSCTVSNGSVTGTKTLTISQPAAALSSSIVSQTSVTCNGGNNAAVTVTVTGGTSSYTYSWTPSGGTGSVASSLSAGSYTCTIKDANQCSKTQTVTVSQPAALSTALSGSTAVTCSGGSNGSATVTASGGTGAYTYSWTPAGGTSSVSSSLSASVYTCIVKDANLCSKNQTVSISQPAALTAAVSSTNVSCNGAANGAATITAGGGNAPYTYSWTPAGGTSSVAGSLSGGVYTCTIKDANLCSKTQTVTISEPLAMSVAVTQNSVSCNGAANGSVTLATSGGTAPYSYSWSPAVSTTSVAASLSGGSYTCTITDANACSKVQTASIAEAALISLGVSQTSVTCNSGTNGSATVTASGGTGAYSYSWTPSGGSASVAASLAAGNYTCTVKDANLCSKTITVNIAEPAAVSASVTQTPASCNGLADGSATVAVASGTAAYTYSWVPSGGTNSVAAALSAGTYSCFIQQAGVCAKVQTVTISEPSAINVSLSQASVNCSGASNGSATVTVSGGTGPYTYSWIPSGGTGSVAASLSAGGYTCQIRDANLCARSQSVTIATASAINSNATFSNVLCNGGNTGSATITATGGTGAYTYSWTPAGGTGSVAASLSAGNYTCIIKDANLCSKTQTVSISEPAALAVSASQTSLNCSGGTNGSATITATGGTGAYTYSWTPSGGTGSVAASLAANVYTCTVKDVNLCTKTQTVTIAQPSAINASALQSNVSCNGSANGSATVTATGGTGAYTYSWTPSGGTASVAAALPGGTYTCTIKDANLCTKVQTVTISEPAALTSSVSQTAVSCNGGTNGSATVTANGGTAPYTYSWSVSGTSSVIASLSAGVYTCTIKDASLCARTQTVSITAPSSISTGVTFSNVLCNGGSSGSATVSATGGTGAYSYSWSPAGGSASIAASLSAGTYTCVVKDVNLCSTTQTVSISAPAAISSSISASAAVCNGQANGSATVTATGGTGAYTYSWMPSGGTASVAAALSAGVYSCMISDANLCVTIQTAAVTAPAAIAATVTTSSVSCNGASNGSATITAAGGTGAYTYSWTPSGTTGSVIASASAGIYSCAIRDANQCLRTQTVAVTGPAAINASANVTNISCNGLSNGAATVTASGGTGAYTYSWTPSAGTGSAASSLSQGTYTCVIKDANLCSKTQTLTISEPSAITTAVSQTSVNCNGGNGGSATLTASGGTGAFTYSWMPAGGTGSVAASLTAGIYTCTVKDANQCAKTQTVSIASPAAITSSVTASNVLCQGGSTGAATVTANGGTGAFTYSWLPSGGTSASASALAAGTYTCIIRDANLCAKTQTVAITQPAALTSSIVSQGNVSCNGGSNGSVTINAGGGTGSYTYSWTPGAGTSATLSALTSGIYTCVIRDANLCSTTRTVLITQPGILTVSVSSGSILCHGNVTTVTVTAGGGTAQYTGTGTFTAAAGAHSYTVTDANGCSSSTSVSVTEPAAITSSQSVTLCAGMALHVGNATHSASGTYTDVLSSSHGCDSTVVSNLVINAPLDVTTVISGSFIVANATGASYQWINCDNANAPVSGATSQSFTPQAAGNYAVIITQNACSDTSSCVNVTMTGLTKNTSAMKFSIYPNPAKNSVMLSSLPGVTGEVTVYDEIGEVIYTSALVNGSIVIDLSERPNGIYFVRLRSEDGSVMKKLIKTE